MSCRKDKQLTSVFKEIKMFPSQEKVNLLLGHLDILCEYFDLSSLVLVLFHILFSSFMSYYTYYTGLPPAGEICQLQAGDEYRDGHQFGHVQNLTYAAGLILLSWHFDDT